MRFYIEEKRSQRGKFVKTGSGRSYPSAKEAFEMKDELDSHGGCGPLRVVDHMGNVIDRATAEGNAILDASIDRAIAGKQGWDR